MVGHNKNGPAPADTRTRPTTQNWSWIMTHPTDTDALTIGTHVHWLTGTTAHHGIIRDFNAAVGCANILPCHSDPTGTARHFHTPGTHIEMPMTTLSTNPIPAEAIEAAQVASLQNRFNGRHIRYATAEGQRSGIVIGVENDRQLGYRLVVRTHPVQVVPERAAHGVWSGRRVDWQRSGWREERIDAATAKIIAAPESWTDLTDAERTAALAQPNLTGNHCQ